MNPQTSQNHDSDVLIEEIYDLFMGKHEPDLVLENIPYLDEWYKDETKEQRAERLRRYAAALEEFSAHYKDFTGLIKQSLVQQKDAAVAVSSKKNKKVEEKILKEIESSLDNQ